MERVFRVVLLCTLATGVATAAAASRVVVPDDHPTVQHAIDSGADTVAIRDDVPPERLTVTRFVVIEPQGSGNPILGGWASVPSIRSLQVLATASCYPCWGVSIRGVRFLGQVTVGSHGDNFHRIVFEACRFDSAFVGPVDWSTSLSLVVRGCMILGSVEFAAGYVQFAGNTVVGGGVTVGADGVHDIRNNLVLGPAPAGLRAELQYSGGPIEGNTIRGVEDGMQFEQDGGTTVANNVVEDCTGHGIRYLALPANDSHPAQLRGNTVRRVHGDGLRLERGWAASIIGNRVEDVGGAGIQAREAKFAPAVDSNVVLRSGQEGIAVGSCAHMGGNIVGGSRDGGIAVGLFDPAPDVPTLLHNTCYSNGGAGIAIAAQADAPRDTLIGNLCAFNSGGGFAWSGAQAPLLACNDWYLNRGGPTEGVNPGESDLFQDPRFCDLARDDVSLQASSPLLSPPGCGRIGALGQGCAASVSVESDARERRSLLARPVPSTSGIAFALPAADGPAWLEVFDVTGARRWAARFSGVIPGEFGWDGRDAAGRRLPAGTYFARFRPDRGATTSARVILVE